MEPGLQLPRPRRWKKRRVLGLLLLLLLASLLLVGLVLYYGGEVGDALVPTRRQPRLTHFLSQIQSLRISLDEQSGQLSEMRNLLEILR